MCFVSCMSSIFFFLKSDNNALFFSPLEHGAFIQFKSSDSGGIISLSAINFDDVLSKPSVRRRNYRVCQPRILLRLPGLPGSSELAPRFALPRRPPAAAVLLYHLATGSI